MVDWQSESDLDSIRNSCDVYSCTWDQHRLILGLQTYKPTVKHNTGPFLFLYLGSTQTYSRSSNSQTNCQTQYWSSLFFSSFRKWSHQYIFLDLQTSSLVPTHVIGSKHRMSRHCFAGSSIPWTMNHFSSKLSRIPDHGGNFCLLRSIWHQM